MTRQEVLEIFAQYRKESPTIIGPGISSRALYNIAHHPATIYNMELGYPASMSMGLALCLPSERVFALEGDGSIIAGLSILTTIARYMPRNLVVVVVNNWGYVTTGSIPSATASGTDLVAMAQGAGIKQAFRAADTEAFEQYMKASVTEDGPFFIVADVEAENMASVGKAKALPFDIVESSIRFRRTLEDRGLVPPIWAD